MNRLTLLFDADCFHLGEIVTRDGAFLSCSLTQDGEAKLGATIREWQTQGLLVRAERERVAPDRINFVVHEQRISLRDPSFFQSLVDWSSYHCIRIVPLDELGIQAWEGMNALPLEPRERYRCIAGLSVLAVEEMRAGIAALQQAVSVAGPKRRLAL